jgi:hypothetical protein
LSFFVPPTRWNANEWLILGTIAAGWTYVYLYRRLFPKPMLVLLLASSLMIAMTLDLLLGAPPLDRYDINDTQHVEWFDMLLYLVYPPFGFLFLHGYTRFRTPQGAVLVYIILFSLFGIVVEWLMDSAGVFRYKGWKFVDSYPVYMLVQGVYILFFRWVRSTYYKTKRN